MKFSLLLAIAGLGLTALPSIASPIAADSSWHQFAFGVAGSSAFGCGGFCQLAVNPTPEQLSNSPWTFTGTGVLTVLDLSSRGDRFEVFDNLVSIGVTSVVANTGANVCSNNIQNCLADAASSRIVLSILGAGAHSVTINVIQNSTGSQAGSAVFQLAAETPEPSTFVMLGGALGFLALRRFRSR